MFGFIKKLKSKLSKKNIKQEELTNEEKSLIEDIIENSNRTIINENASINHVSQQIELTYDDNPTKVIEIEEFLATTPIVETKEIKKKNKKKIDDYKGKPKIVEICNEECSDCNCESDN